MLPDIKLERCTACALCVTYCPTKAVELRDHKPVIVRPDDCVYCGQCEDMCPANAITLSYEIHLPQTH
jgi:NAD-dependent dihydropyrimidine dehydrogenase PreA subunit